MTICKLCNIVILTCNISVGFMDRLVMCNHEGTFLHNCNATFIYNFNGMYKMCNYSGTCVMCNRNGPFICNSYRICLTHTCHGTFVMHTYIINTYVAMCICNM